MHVLVFDERGVRCLLRVAARGAPGSLELRELARMEGLAPAEVQRAMEALRAHGVIETTGADATTYRLARPAREISVWRAVEALGGELFPEGACDCSPRDAESCIHRPDRMARALWSRLAPMLRGALDDIALEDLQADGP